MVKSGEIQSLILINCVVINYIGWREGASYIVLKDENIQEFYRIS